jgi:hypothetical protein
MQTAPLPCYLVRDEQSWMACLENSYAALRSSWQGPVGRFAFGTLRVCSLSRHGYPSAFIAS